MSAGVFELIELHAQIMHFWFIFYSVYQQFCFTYLYCELCFAGTVLNRQDLL